MRNYACRAMPCKFIIKLNYDCRYVNVYLIV
uniref:Uncharacterized protein n=1 Tax=Arundo donax TaxID=35708 RepID=A0A0A9HX22_ARUDO